jgi:hypothetical protein
MEAQKMDRDRVSLAVATGMAITVASLFFVVSRFPLTPELAEAAMVVVGMSMMAALAAVSSYLQGTRRVPVIQISFDETNIRKTLKKLIATDYGELNDKVIAKEGRWEPTSDDLLTQDPTLALAKLRIDIERELRRIAFDRGLKTDNYAMTVRFLLNMLADRGILKADIVAAIDDLLPACNQAIHGGAVTSKVARAVLNVGADLLTVLYLV